MRVLFICAAAKLICKHLTFEVCLGAKLRSAVDEQELCIIPQAAESETSEAQSRAICRRQG